MTTLVGTLGRVRAAGQGELLSRLGAAVNGLLERWTDDPALICGDSDSSLMAIGRDLQSEARLLYRRRGA